MDEFARCFAHVLVHEGGKVDHPKDPGGRTNKGVTQRVYNGYRSSLGQGPRDVYSITDAEVEAIYRRQYWTPISGDQLPAGVNLVVFDGAVNSGVKQSVKWLQRALGFPATQVDGILGLVTLNAIKANTDHDKLIADIIDRREKFLRALKTFKTFGRGWLKRIGAVKATGQAWAMGTVGPAPEHVPDGNQKATIDDARKAPPKAPGDLGVAGGGGTAVTSQAIEQLSPFEGIHLVKNLIIGLTIAGAVIAIVAGVYRWWATRKQAELADALDTGVQA